MSPELIHHGSGASTRQSVSLLAALAFAAGIAFGGLTAGLAHGATGGVSIASASSTAESAERAARPSPRVTAVTLTTSSDPADDDVLAVYFTTDRKIGHEASGTLRATAGLNGPTESSVSTVSAARHRYVAYVERGGLKVGRSHRVYLQVEGRQTIRRVTLEATG